MQYPLEGLTLALGSTLMSNDKSCIPDTTEGISSLKIALLKLFEQIPFALCDYLATAQNEQQAAYMLHALKISLYHIVHTLSTYKELAVSADHQAFNNQAELYDYAIEETNKLNVFLCAYFTNLPSFSIPSYAHPAKLLSKDTDSILQTNLSVPQLALFMRLLVESGVIAERNNITQLTSKAAAILQTKKSNCISAESLRIKYYAPEKAAINILKEYVSQMMQLLCRY
ncbi:hypothetical protein FRZ67_11615 [Panacibacter ginsenosidivorans]|uniref:Uncharacterized protein n=1 Tax=Panacibacter ginsenosidivorans TaxID=1813871 RepID=A0A5B8V9U2_9BACT|nr:hypothetical protein [Panacibacter ginsenosidivorans]QEC67915.1 hypothetical protein FRZ67_11615 [Panacibacter ginsenosidivorans]